MGNPNWWANYLPEPFECPEVCELNGTDSCDECPVYIDWCHGVDEPEDRDLVDIMR